MGNKTLLAISIPCLLICAAVVWLFVQNREIRQEIAALHARVEKEARRPQMKVASRPLRPPRPPQPPSVRIQEPSKPVGGEGQDGADEFDERIKDAVKGHLASQRQEAKDSRARRLKAIAALTPEEKVAQREAFVSKMRARAQQRLKTFVANTGLDAKQTEAFENTVSALDSTLRETANTWAEQIRNTGTFSRDAQVKFVGEINSVLSAGYGEMDATLPSTWRESEGNVNLMEIVGPEALSSMVEALTESGLEEGLQTIGQVMGRPDGEGGDAPEGFEGIESPGVGDGPGGMTNPGGANGPGGPGPGGPGM